MSEALYDYTRQDASGASCTAHAWAKVPAALTPAQKADHKAHIARLLKSEDAVLVPVCSHRASPLSTASRCARSRS